MAVFPARREIRVIDVPFPSLRGDREVMVRMREVGICGTDREIAAFHLGTPPPGQEALVIGHEALGEVLEIGSSVRTVKPGDLVTMTVRRPCNDDTCAGCRVGRQDFCVTGYFRERGIKEADGFMTELVVEDERYLVRVPRSLADVAVLVEPLTISAKAFIELETILRRFPWEPVGLRALVLGAGPIGILGAMMLMANDVEVTVYSRESADSHRAQLLRSLGGQYISAEETPIEALSSQGSPFNVILEALGTASVAFGALHALAANGVCIFSGNASGEKPIEMHLDRIMRNIVHQNQMIFGTVNASRSAFEAALHQLEQFMSLFPEAVRSLITERVGLEDAPRLLREAGGIKQVVTLAA
jgi:glucose 1-dehydrogenase